MADKEIYNSPRFPSLFAAEESVLNYWQKEKIFEKSLEKNAGKETYSFYDGPPFITGLPHYATLLPSIAKDIIPRYQTMKGKQVRRVWGWDVHGLPAENQVEKKLNLKGKKDIEALGVDKFVAACREYVSTTSEQWRWYIDHIGRWVDIDNAYRTDQLSFMESVMWAFKQLYDRDLIYQGRRVSLYCPRCATPLSKFEITMDEGNYRDVEDSAVTVKFKLADEETFVLAWTTTPWTLPANLALAVDKDAEYVKVTDGKQDYILAHQALERYREMDLEIVETFKGEKLVGKSYQPLYTFFETNSNDYKIYAGDFVAMTEGTGVVHIAPGFGEDDTKLGEQEKLSLLLTINDEGHFTEEVSDWRGMYYKKANPPITADLKERGLLLKEETITHSYPHCYRCGTPLIYKSQVSWYLRISELKNQLLDTNKFVHWHPKHFGAGRFAYNVENAPDWSLSRTRYWGSPIPVWQTEDGETIVVGSLKELEELSGQKVTDLHRPHIDNIVLTTKSGKKAHRVKEVLDCWFESGSMPFAQFNYPFNNEKEFEQSLPADFIIEYTGQLRGWFYYLHVLANALFQKNAFTNVAVTGVLMGTDGRKMSKSYGNYPDPKATIEKYGAEALRLYFMGSKIMAGEDLVMNEEDIREESRLLQTLHNSFRYFVTYANVHHFKPGKGQSQKTALDRWIELRLGQFIETYSQALDGYDFATATRAIRPFIEDLSTWYIRRSRDRFVAGDEAALETLHDVLKTFALAVAPTLPFSAELIYQTLTGEADSVHLQNYPTVNEPKVAENSQVLNLMDDVRAIASVVHKIRADEGKSLRQPLAALSLVGFENLVSQDEYLEILKDEVNVGRIEFSALAGFVTVEHDGKEIGLDVRLTPELEEEGRYRELARLLQDARKKAGLQVGQKVTMHYYTADKALAELLQQRASELEHQISLTELVKADNSSGLTTVVPGEDLSLRFE